jgi:hypothetical protein
VTKSLTPPRFGSRGRALELIRSQCPIRRIELAQSPGLTQATISHAVRSLIRDGLVREIGRGAPTGGKPRMMVEINPDARFGVGVQLGLGSIVYVVVNLSGCSTWSWSYSRAPRSPARPRSTSIACRTVWTAARSHA